MGAKEILYNEIKSSLLDRGFLTAEGMTKKDVEVWEPSIDFAADVLIAATDDEGRIDSRDILEAGERCFSAMASPPDEGWQLHCYRYVRHRLFPHLEDAENPDGYRSGRNIALRLLRGVYEYERKTLPFSPLRDMELLSDSEVRSRGFTSEYIKMRKLIRSENIYEFMRLGVDIMPFNTLGHICGVHYIAMHAARQLFQAGLPVDLALISGAAASHDIGKYGCRKQEEKRVPHLHYYYTNYCMTNFGMPDIGHIAANHSTWDLELENLSAESLLLIYADFRVKGIRGRHGEEIIRFYSLSEAFDVILGKLENVDEKKRRRYERVYAKLKDFEDYMISLGVDTELCYDGTGALQCKSPAVPRAPRREPALMTGDEVIDELKLMSVDHNIRLMSRFNERSDFMSLIEAARGEANRMNLRTYISIFDDYATYMSEEQKSLVLEFLYERLMNRESDIREQAARQMGRMVATFREAYKKELPEGIPQPEYSTTNLEMYERYLSKLMNPPSKLTEQHRYWIKQSTDFYVRAVLANCRKAWRNRYLEILERYYSKPDYGEFNMFVLLSTALALDPEQCTEQFRAAVRRFTEESFGRSTHSVDLLILDVEEHYLGDEDGEIRKRRRDIMGVDDPDADSEEILSSMFLDDLKFQTRWADKLANIRYMLEEAEASDGGRRLHVATHYVNLIKGSETVSVRREAGSALLKLVRRMTRDQRNEIMVELYNGLEIDDYQFSRFIPDFLGIVLLYLLPEEFDEIIGQLEKHLYTGNVKTAGASLTTLSIAIENYSLYEFEVPQKERTARYVRILGILMKGFAYYSEVISREAFRVIGEHIYASEVLTPADKREATDHIAKRIITILAGRGDERSALEFYNEAGALNSIYKFICEYEAEEGSFNLSSRNRVAFFPGTFDPFSQGHKEIARTIRDRGFEVYMALDEFSWSKKTLPHMLRRDIIRMSISDEENLTIFPDDISINIANPEDLAELRRLFRGRELYVAVGSDVVRNASAYKRPPEENSIHSFNHIVFARESRQYDAAGESHAIKGDVINLTLRKFYEDISSTRIRENIDLGRDISNLLDPVVQKFIYENNYYSREPAYKHEIQARDINISTYRHENCSAIGEMYDELERVRGYDRDVLSGYFSDVHVRAVYIESGKSERRAFSGSRSAAAGGSAATDEGHRIAAFAAARRVETHELLEEFGDSELTAQIRSRSSGAIAVIGAMYARPGKAISNLGQMILTEILTDLLAKDYTYVVYHPVDKAGLNATLVETLKRQGFVNISGDTDNPAYAVDMTAPLVVFRDLDTVIKAPLNKNPRVLKAVDEAHFKMLRTLTELYPGRLVLSFNTSAVYSKIVDLVAGENGVSVVPDPDKRRGPYMAVPFGKAMSDVVVPNTVTKQFRTEKYFNNNIIGFNIRQSMNYATLEDQAKTLKSFDRPVILIDDLLHSGQRIKKIDPILREAGVDVRKVIVGLLTGNARDDMTIKGREVEGAYFIPNISMWLNEHDCYPFIGGDSIDPPEDCAADSAGNVCRHRSGFRGDAAVRGAVGSSINLCLPYTSFNIVGRGDRDKMYKYSMTCLENARDIMKTLENEYQAAFEKRLTLKRLGAVITYPRRPEYGAGLILNENMPPSSYIESDIRRAERLHLYSGR